ncbi:hypothetical protein CWB73_12305, partial [Pseudoalteromonas phenolica]
RSGQDLQVALKSTGETLTIDRYFSSSVNRVELVKLDDGSIIDLDHIVNTLEANDEKNRELLVEENYGLAEWQVSELHYELLIQSMITTEAEAMSNDSSQYLGDYLNKMSIHIE